MADFKIRTRGDASPKGKPRIYFTSHPRDLGKYLEKTVADLLGVGDFAIYYTADMTAGGGEEDYRLGLEVMNLMVIPVTHALLCDGCRAMEHDLPFAVENHIPVLPLMMESGLDAIYSAPDRFGGMQYLMPVGGDASAIAYPLNIPCCGDCNR